MKAIELMTVHAAGLSVLFATLVTLVAPLLGVHDNVSVQHGHTREGQVAIPADMPPRSCLKQSVNDCKRYTMF